MGQRNSGEENEGKKQENKKGTDSQERHLRQGMGRCAERSMLEARRVKEKGYNSTNKQTERQRSTTKHKAN